MSREIGGIFVNFKTNVASFLSDMDKAQAKSTAAGFLIAKAMTAVGASILRMGQQALTFFPRLIQSSLDMADEMSKASQRTGVAVESLAGLRHAAELANVDFEQLETGLGKFAKTILGASFGLSTAKRSFSALNVDFRDSQGNLRATEDVLGDVAERFAGMEDGTAKTALAMELFGRSGKQLIPLLNEGKAGLAAAMEEARRLGLVLDENTGKAAERFNDAMTKLQRTMTGVGLQMTAALAPGMASIAEAAVRFASDGERVVRIATAIAETFSLAAKGVSYLVEGFLQAARFGSALYEGLVKLDAKLESVRNKVTFGLLFQEQADAAAIAADNAARATDDFSNVLSGLQDFRAEVERGGNIRLPKIIGEGVDLDAEETEEQKKAMESLTAAFQKSLEPATALNEDLQKLLASGKSVADITAVYGEQILKAVEAQHAHGKAIEGPVAGLYAIARAQESARNALELLISSALPKHLEGYEQWREKIEQLRKEHEELQFQLSFPLPRSLLDFGEAAKLATVEVDKTKKAADEFGRSMENLTHTVAQGFEDAILRGQGLRDVLAGILEDIGRLILRSTITGPEGILRKAIDSIGGALKGVFGFQGGGSLRAGQMAVVGESGPELFRADVSGQIVPNEKIAVLPAMRGAAAVPQNNIQVIYQIDARGADIGVVQRIESALRIVEERSVARSVASIRELALRRA